MIIYNQKLKEPNQLDMVITKEIDVIDELQVSQNNLKAYTNLYIEELSVIFKDNEVFKNMLLTSFETALFQVEINSQDLVNLNNILEILLNNNSQLQENIEQYNKIFVKVEKNITIVREILKKALTSFEQLSSVSSNFKPSPENVEKLEEARRYILDIKEEDEKDEEIARNIREISNESSDFLCFFPKTDNDILAISTVQDSYKVMFNEEVATVCIEEENFNFTLKTVGVQISNSENVLLISRKSPGYFILTNMTVEIPKYINVSRVDRNQNFIEIGVNNKSLSVSINKNEVIFSDELEEKEEKIATNTTNVTNNDNISSIISAVGQTNTAPNFSPKEPIINKLFGEPVSKPQYEAPIQQPQVAAPVYQQPQQVVTPIIEQPQAPVYSQPQVVAPVAEQPIIQPKIETPIQKPVVEEKVIDNSNVQNNGIDLTKDNDTLIISERDNQIILPYKLSDVEKQFNQSKKKYSSVKDLIQNEYIVPADNFKNPIKSRFREAYQLIKKKEHGHLKEALELGFEVMFNSNLNPAVIAACKNLEELDIYLDCLDDNQLDKFSCFNIIYNVPPTSGKNKHSL